MTPGTNKTAPSLAELTMRFVNRPIDASAIESEADALGEVVPHEVSVGFRADPRLAWQEGLGVLDAFGLKGEMKAAAPAEWAGIVVRQDAAAAQPFALGNYPQRVRELATLLQTADLSKLLTAAESRPASPALRGWAAKQAATGSPANALLAAAVLRAAGDLEQAETTLNVLRAAAPASWQAAVRNEEAALLWQQGQFEKAAAIWDALDENPAVLFNRGLAALFLGRSAKARESLKKASVALPETGGWHHLAGLYLALAEMRN